MPKKIPRKNKGDVIFKYIIAWNFINKGMNMQI